jgi:transcriptional regulator with XRE-family HTH domain
MSDPPQGIHRDFALRFREACTRANAPTTLKALGLFFNVSPATVHDWRHGEKLPSAQTLAEIATKLRVNYDWLATGRGEITTLPSAKTIALARRIERIDEEAQEYINVILTTAEHRQHIS